MIGTQHAPITSQDLRDQAAALRAAGVDALPPAPEVLGVLPIAGDRPLQLSWLRWHGGTGCLSLKWRAFVGGRPLELRVRARQLPELAEMIATALDIALAELQAEAAQ
jgi:hypothetical protein